MAGLIYLDAENWRYENAGTADTLIVSGTTLTNLPRTKSITGTAFYQTTKAKSFDLPSTKEIWIKFDVYFNGSTRWRAYNTGTDGDCGIASYGSSELDFIARGSYVREQDRPLKANQLQTVLLHMISGSTAGVIEAWVDSDFIYRYTGSLNRGEDFADIYLQSDGSGTFFSNVIISNVEIGLDENVDMPFGVPAIKPEIYISWIPLGKIGLKPQIYATYIPIPIREKISADTNRKISKPESIFGDLQRQVGIGEKVSADVTRHVISTDTAVADTKRKLSVEEKISGDTFRKIVQSEEIHADTYRDVQSTEKVVGDTSRKIGVTTLRADLQRRVNVTTIVDGDTCRRVEVEEKISGDISLKVTCAEIVRADTYRKVEDLTPTVTKADTNRFVGIREKVIADTSLNFAQREKASADTLLQTAIAEKIIADTMRGIREVIRADTCRRVTRAEKAVARTVIRVPHVLNYIVQPKQRTLKSSPRLRANNPASLINTFKDYGVTSINITLSEKTLSDDFRFDIAARSVEINEAVQGYLLDYPFSFLVEETSQTELVQSVKGRYSIDDLIYTQFFIPTLKLQIDEDTTLEIPGGHIEKYRDGSTAYYYPKATDIVTKIAQYFGTLPVILIDDFTPYNLSGDHKITYADLLNSVFGWTSRLPQRQINVFIRGGILYCIQRGKEPTVFDITDLSHSRPTINKKLLRSLWSNPKGEDATLHGGNHYETPADPIYDYQFEIIPQPFSGTIEFSDSGCSTTLQYENGLLRRESNHVENAKATISSSVSYNYIEIYPAGMTELEIAQAKGFNNKNQFYGDFYLSTKIANSTATTYDEEDVSVNFHNEGWDGNDYVITDGTNTATVPKLKEVSQSGKTIYRYTDTNAAEIYLSSEYDQNTTKTYETQVETNNETGAILTHMELTDVKTDVRETFHVPIGNGWYGQSVYHNGETQGSNISQGKPGNKVSQYTIKDVQATFWNSKVTLTVTEPNPNHDDNDDDDDEQEDDDDWRRKLAPIVDTSFPVRELDLLYELTDDLLWLNRKVEETVTVDLTSKIVDGVPELTHIVDFTERVKFNGAEYYLVSNKISFTPRKLIQKLTLIRWY